MMKQDEITIIKIPLLGVPHLQIAALNVEQINIKSWLCGGSTLLSTYRKDHARKYYHEADQQRCIGASLLLDHFLRPYGLREAAMEYGMNEHGKPYFLHHPELHFNLSHSEKFAVAAFADHPIGVDIEKITPFDPETAAFCMKESEIRALQSHPKGAHDFLFTTSWCLKEAIVKAKGTGIEDEFPIVQLKQGIPHWEEDPTSNLSYRIFRLEDYVGAIVF